MTPNPPAHYRRGLRPFSPRDCQRRTEAANACSHFEQTAGQGRGDGLELWNLGTRKNYAAGGCSHTYLVNRFDSGVIVAELTPHPE